MNIKRGLKRIWVVITVLYFLMVYWTIHTNYKGITFDLVKKDFLDVISIPIGFWVFLYVCFWITSGFTNNKKKDETNE